MTARDIAIIVAVALSLPFLALSVHQQWSRNGTTKGMIKYGLVSGAIILTGMLAAYLLGLTQTETAIPGT